MIYKHIHHYGYYDYLSIALLALLPNLLGLLNIRTSVGITIHFFQIAIFLAAFFYGRYAGLLAGAVGSIASTVMMSNPYILVGNMILGFFAGYFMEKRIAIVPAVLLAFAIQVPWLLFSDIVLMGMPVLAVLMIAVSLLICDTVFALSVKVLSDRLP